MKIVVDDKIPYIREKLELLADEVVYKSGGGIVAADVADADALVVRTRTRCDERLLGGSRVRLVATATIGYDHIDTDWLRRAGIAWTNCPGCNSGSVAQYVECSLLLLERHRGLLPRQSTMGIVGCGHVGSKVRRVAGRMGMRVLVCDPPLEKLEAEKPRQLSGEETSRQAGEYAFVSLDTIAREADIISFHVPLTLDGPYATWHLADEDFFSRLSRTPFIINTSRGEVTDNQALAQALRKGLVRDAVVDVWEGEPQVSEELLRRVFIGTPHIAGYSADGKVHADNMVIDALCQTFHLPHPGRIAPPPLPADFVGGDSPLDWYNPLSDSDKLKQDASKFEYLRNHYPLRRERAAE